jgi:hypothetical protein
MGGATLGRGFTAMVYGGNLSLDRDSLLKISISGKMGKMRAAFSD